MSLPLAGKRVIVTRPRHQAEGLAQKLKELGAGPILIPTIQVLPPADWKPIDQAIKNLAQFDWVVFTSANGVEAFTQRMKELSVSTENLARCKLAAIGPATAKPLTTVCRAPDLIPPVFISDAIAEEIGEVKNQKILLARADIARKDLALQLQKKGAEVVDLAVYRVQGEVDQELLQNLSQIAPQGAPDFITLTSPSAARELLQILEQAGLKEWMHQSALICIGPITGEAVEEMGFKVARVARQHTTEGIVEALFEEVKVESGRAN